MHIGIAGNIGCGKTTLTRMLAEHYGWIPKYEAVTYNPYLEDYYKDIERWSYNLETYFLAQRFQDLIEISKSEDVIIQGYGSCPIITTFTSANGVSSKAVKISSDGGKICVDAYSSLIFLYRFA